MKEDERRGRKKKKRGKEKIGERARRVIYSSD